MKKGSIIVAVGVAIALTGGYLTIFGWPGSKATQYEFATVSRGDIETTISATGVLSPTTTIEVGTQISGTIDSVYVDYNDTVSKGQLLAVLDTTLLRAAITEAEATLERSEAALEEAQIDYDRNKSLFERNLIAEATFLPYETALKTQRANLKSAEVAMQKALRNLKYAVIRSPIKGIVISKNVEAGQTVAASLSTPTLFIIAEDLSRMEILAEVDESDIGEIKVGQNVRFEVATYSGRKFTGKVKQVRLQPETVSNVVTYTVVVEAANEDNLLLPGMTASLDFTIDSRTDVLIIPSKAFRYQPTDDELLAFHKRQQKKHKGERPPSPPMAGDSSATPSTQESVSMAWYLDSLGQLAAVPVRAGLTDGTNTEVVDSREIEEGMKVIIGIADEAASKKTSSRMQGPGGFGPPRF